MIYGVYLPAEFYEKAEGCGLTVDGEGEDLYCFGLSMDEIGDDETGKQFKKRAHDLLKKFCMDNLEPFMVPKYVEFRKSLPKSIHGKVDKKAL